MIDSQTSRCVCYSRVSYAVETQACRPIAGERPVYINTSTIDSRISLNKMQSADGLLSLAKSDRECNVDLAKCIAEIFSEFSH